MINIRYNVLTGAIEAAGRPDQIGTRNVISVEDVPADFYDTLGDGKYIVYDGELVIAEEMN